MSPPTAFSPRRAPLFVSGGTEREVSDAEEAMMRDHAIAYRPHMAQSGAHPPVDDHCSTCSYLCARSGQEICVGAHPTTTRTTSALHATASPSRVPITVSPPPPGQCL